MHIDIIMMIVFLIDLTLCRQKNIFGDIFSEKIPFLPCIPRSCAPRSGSPKPCRRRLGRERGRCCRTLK